MAANVRCCPDDTTVISFLSVFPPAFLLISTRPVSVAGVFTRDVYSIKANEYLCVTPAMQRQKF